MGDHADDALNNTVEMESFRNDYKFGFMTRNEAYNMGIFDEPGVEISGIRTTPRVKVLALNVREIQF